jgi:hypothetical protein
MISFRVGSFDAEILEKEFAPVFTMEDIVNLGFAQIYLKLMINSVASQPFSATTLPPIEKPAVSFREDVMEMSRKVYARPKAEVERVIREWHAPEPEPAPKPIVPKNAATPDRPRFEVKKPDLPIRKDLDNKLPPKLEENKNVKIDETSKNGVLDKAIEEAMKTKHDTSPQVNSNNTVPKIDLKIGQKKEEPKEENGFSKSENKVSLQDLRKDERNKNKEATPENKNALKEALKNNRPVLISINARKLGNPKYLDSGPLYHMVVVRGFEGDVFIVNDPGTNGGANNKYTFEVLKNAAADWDQASKTMLENQKIALVLSR